MQLREPDPNKMIIGLDAVESLVETAQEARYQLGDSELGEQLQDAIDRVQDAEHMIDIDTDGWAIQHPLRCRPAMLNCAMHKLAVLTITKPPMPPGRYVLSTRIGQLKYEAIDD